MPTKRTEPATRRPVRRRRRSPSDAELIGPLPLLAVRDTVLFPHLVVPLFVSRERGVRAIEEAMARDRTVVVLAQRDPEVEDVGPDDVFDVGTEAVIGRMLK